MFGGRHNSEMNFRGWTEKPVYEAGERMTIFVTGGDQPGWVRVGVRDHNGEEVARATGPTGMGDDGDPNWTASVFPGPIVLHPHAPYLPGTYQWSIGWFGKVDYPNPSVMLEHALQWHYVPGPTFEVYSNDLSGPSMTAMTASPNPSGGVRDVVVSALASDAASGKTPLREARYRIVSDSVGPNQPWLPLLAADGEFDAAEEVVRFSVNASGRAPGDWVITMQAADALGNWGPVGQQTFRLSRPPLEDWTPPSGVCGTAQPSVAPPRMPVKVSIRIDDRTTGGSPIYGAEAFVSAPGNDGAGIPLEASDGALDSPVESLDGLVETTGLAEGVYPVVMHGVDAAGLWGTYCITSFQVDPSADPMGPSVKSVVLAPSPTAGAAVAVLRARTSDLTSGFGVVTNSEFYLDPLTPAGSGTPMFAEDGRFDEVEEVVTGAVNVSGWSPGAYLIRVRGRDDRGRWGPEMVASLLVSEGGADMEGPVISGLNVIPNPTQGAPEIKLKGFADDAATGGSHVALIEYYVNSADIPGSGTTVLLKGQRSVAPFNASIPADLVLAGKYLPIIYARAMDVHGNWGPLSAATFNVTSMR